MGKDRVKESLIREIANLVVHEIVAKHTNRPESSHFLNSEVIEYRNRAEKTAEEYNWNEEDRNNIEKKALQMIKEKLAAKYSDVKYSEQEIIKKLNDMIKNMI